MTKKIGIINFQYSNHNYGAVLQAAALEYVIRDSGYEAEHINFIPQTAPMKSTLIQKLRSVLGKVKRTLLPSSTLIKKVAGSEVFELFRSQWLTRTSQTYRRMDDLEFNKSGYYAIVVGSDQVWRPHYTNENALAFFLSFVPSEVKRIAYAASFGVDFWEEKENVEFTNCIKGELEKFSAISVREKSAINICNDVFNLSTMHVLDPTLLVDRSFFDSIIKEAGISSTYADIVYYKLDTSDIFLNQVDVLGNNLSYSIENIYYTEKDGKQFYNPVADWLKKMSESKLVITDSFHCVCFSIVFKKQFIYYPNNTRGMTRLESLLGDLGIADRIYNDKISFTTFAESCTSINYDKVTQQLVSLRKTSLEFLTNALAESSIDD